MSFPTQMPAQGQNQISPDGKLGGTLFYFLYALFQRTGGPSGILPGGVRNVIDFGADPTGKADSAPAFRAVLGSNRVIVVPPGTYLFKSTVLNTFPPPGVGTEGQNAIFIDSFNDWAIFGYGATINIDPSIAASTVIDITRCNNWQIFGLTINQASAGALFNPGIGITSCVNFHISDITFGPGLNFQAFFGAFVVDGLIENIHMSHGQGGDFTLIKNMKFRNWRADGGNTTPSGLFFGIATDVFTLPSFNTTGITINFTDGVEISGMDVSGYNTCVLLREGANYLICNNHFHDMPGPTVAPVGVQIVYVNGGNNSSVGNPPRGIIIEENSFVDFGSGTPGYGVFVDPSAIVNADVISDLTINDNTFRNVNFAGIYLNGTAHASNFVYGRGNLFSVGISTAVSVDFRTLANVVSGSGSPTGSFAFTDGLVTHL